jgi:hypothetical protein
MSRISSPPWRLHGDSGTALLSVENNDLSPFFFPQAKHQTTVLQDVVRLKMIALEMILCKLSIRTGVFLQLPCR